MATPTPDSYTFTPGTTLYAGLPTPPVGTLLQTLRLVNTSSSEQSADFVTKSFGVQFKQGDLPSGQWPEFRLAGGTLCVPTISEVATWPDGSMKKCAVFMRVPASVPGSTAYSESVAFSTSNADFSSIPVEVYSGGEEPAAGTRTTSDLTAADLKIQLTGVTNLSGVWLAELNAAITAGADVVRIAHGPAGSYWRIGTDFMQSAAAHGQLYGKWYIFAMTNSSGGLLGLRRMEKVEQMWCDVASPTPTKRVASCVVLSGATTVRTMTGHDTTETPGANIGITHGSGFYCVGTDGEYEFLQGGGSASSDCTIRVVHEPVKVVRSRMVQPIDTSVNAAVGSAVSYYPYGASGIARAMGTTGNRDDIGVLPSWAVRHLITQSGRDYTRMRCAGLASAGFPIGRLVSSTTAVPVLTDHNPSGYTGLGANHPDWEATGGGGFVGYVQPVSNPSLWSLSGSHFPSCNYYPYIMTGERQFADDLSTQAPDFLSNTDPGTRSLKVTLPTDNLSNPGPYDFRNIQVGVGGPVFKGAGLMWWLGGTRQSAWQLREVAMAAAALPDVDPAGTDVKQYLTDIVDQTYQAMNALNAARPTSWQDSGLMSNTSFEESNTTADGAYESPWMTMYLSSSLCLQSQITGLSSAATFRAHLAKFISSTHANMDLSALASYRWRQWKEDGSLVMDIADLLASHSATISYSASTNRGTVGGALGTWTPQNGDQIAYLRNGTKPFPSLVYNKSYYMVNCSGQTFQMSETEGGSVIDIPTDVSIFSDGFVQLQDSGSQRTLSTDGDNYITLVYEAARFHEACGDTVVNSARLKQDADRSSFDFTVDPKNAILPAYPA